MTSRFAKTAGLLAALVFNVQLAQAQVVGRVLMAVGEVSADRSGAAVPLTVGSNIENKDVIRVGADSNAQIRFTDEGIVALRAKTVFRVDNYNFAGKEDAFSQAAFSLVRGGFRTVTGLIGRGQRDRYSVKAPIATVGIRGTSYTLVVCQQDCLDSDGTLAPDGNYGVVQEGRVAITNDAGTAEFGLDEAFFVSDTKTLAQPLLSRPGFLRDRLEARARQRDRQGQQVVGREPPRPGPLDPRKEEPREIRPINGNPQAPIGATDLRDESGNIAVLGAGLGVGVSWSAGAEERAQVEGGRGTVITIDGQTKAFEGFAFFTGGMAGSRQQAAIKDAGGIPGDGGMAWGRWDTGGVINLNGQIIAPPTGVHFLYGNLTPPTALNTSAALRGTIEYEYAGGPRPTDGQGHVGQFLSGNFTVDFLSRSISGEVLYQVGDVTYKIPVPTATPLIGGQGFVGFGLNRNNVGGWSCPTCSVRTGTIDAASIAGLFMGSRAQGLGVTFSTRDIDVGRTAGAAAFKCKTGPC